MHFSAIKTTLVGAAVSVSASSLYARQIADLPGCGEPCMATSNVNLGGCVASDTTCLCTNPVWVTSTTNCLELACTGTDLQTALELFPALCLSAGVTLTASNTAPASSASGSAAASITSHSTQSTAHKTSMIGPIISFVITGLLCLIILVSLIIGLLCGRRRRSDGHPELWNFQQDFDEDMRYEEKDEDMKQDGRDWDSKTKRIPRAANKPCLCA